MKSKTNILCSTDEAYVPWCGVMLTSLFENNQDERMTVYVLTAGLSKKAEKELKDLAERYGQAIRIVGVDDAKMRQFPMKETDHVSVATYYRLAAPELLPADIDKILYLDCDMIINSSIRALWDTDMPDAAVAGVLDESYFQTETYQRLGMQQENGYFNAGMLLINLRYWREHNVMQRCFECLERMPDKLLFHDQDTLNVVLEHEKKWLPIKWNFQTGYLFTRVTFEESFAAEIREAAMDPAIIHYTGPNKPWFAWSKTPFVPYFRHYKGISPWRDTPLIGGEPTIKERLKNILYETVWRLGIKKRPQHYIIPTQKWQG